MILLKTIVWRTLSFSIVLVLARIWFGDWKEKGII